MFEIVVGNIVDSSFIEKADAIVNPSNPKMRMGMGVSGVIFQKAGVDILEKYCEDKYGVGYGESKDCFDMKVTEVRITPGFNLGCSIIFAQGPNDIYFDTSKEEMIPLLMKTYDNVFKEIKRNNYKRVLFPSIGTGHYGISHEDISKKVVKSLQDFANENGIDVILVLFDEKTASFYRKYK